ncbi:hypothetical protein DSECCO2_561250 [anaerobic digester metagenome]
MQRMDLSHGEFHERDAGPGDQRFQSLVVRRREEGRAVLRSCPRNGGVSGSTGCLCRRSGRNHRADRRKEEQAGEDHPDKAGCQQHRRVRPPHYHGSVYRTRNGYWLRWKSGITAPVPGRRAAKAGEHPRTEPVQKPGHSVFPSAQTGESPPSRATRTEHSLRLSAAGTSKTIYPVFTPYRSSLVAV